MNICALPGTKVIFINKGGYGNSAEAAREAGFIEGNQYTVHDIDVSQSCSYVYFEEIRGSWNSVMFDDIPEVEETTPDVPKLTHSFTTLGYSKDDVDRYIDIAKFDNNDYVVKICTKWSPKSDPIETVIQLKQEGFQMLLDAMNMAAHNIDKFEVK